MKKNSVPRMFVVAILSIGAILFVGGGIFLNGVLASPVVTNAVALNDLDGDGDLDALLVNGKNEGISSARVLINQGGAQAREVGTFKATSQQIGAWNYVDAALGDLDNDGDADAILVSDHALEIFRNQGSDRPGGAPRFEQLGGKQAAADFWSGDHSIALGDVDGDGDLDALTGHCCGGAAGPGGEGGLVTVLQPVNGLWINALKEEGSLRLDPSSLEALGYAGSQAVLLGDLDGDGDLDAYIGNYSQPYDPASDLATGAADWIWWNDGAGHFSDSGQRLGSDATNAAALGDLDGDGDLDIFSADRGGELRVWFNQAANFQDSGQSLSVTGIPSGVLLGDLDGDGDLDGVLAAQAAIGARASIIIWQNDGQAKFTRWNEFTQSPHAAAALGDVDNDGDLDIFSGFQRQSYVWYNDGRGKFRSWPKAN